MSETYTIIAIVGFAAAVVLAVPAAIMFFALRIRQVRDSLTGRTAARSIAETRSRAQGRKRTASDAAKRLGWDQEATSGVLETFADAEAGRSTNDLHPASESATTVLSGAPEGTGDGEGATTMLAPDREGEEPGATAPGGPEAGTTMLGEGGKRNSGGKR